MRSRTAPPRSPSVAVVRRRRHPFGGATVFLCITVLCIRPIECRFNFSEIKNETCLRSKDIENNLDLSSSLITFRFFANESMSDVFHLPRCIFTHPLTDYLFDHMKIYSSVDEYKAEFQSTYLPGVEGTYKTVIIQGPDDNGPYLDKTKLTEKEESNEGNFITYNKTTYIHRYPLLSLVDDPECEVFEDVDEMFLPFFGRCRNVSMTVKDVTVFSTITSVFSTLKYMFVNKTQHSPIRVFFGNADEVVTTMPFEPSDLALRITRRDDLLVAGKKDPVQYMLNHIQMNSIDDMLRANHEHNIHNLKHLFSTFNQHVKKILDGKITYENIRVENMLEAYISWLIAAYVQYKSPHEHGLISLDDYIWTETALQASVDVFELFTNNMQVSLPVRKNASDLVDLILTVEKYIPVDSEHPPNHKGLSLMYLKYIYLQNVTSDIAEYASTYMRLLYDKYTYPENTETSMYKHHDDVYDLFLLNHMAIKSSNMTLLRQVLLMQTSLCNVKNLLGHFHSLESNSRDLGHLVSPCFRCLRYDFTQEKIESMVTQETLSPYGRLTRMVHMMTKNSSMLDVLKCPLPEENLLAILPFSDTVTYVVSKKPVVQGEVYRATHTAIGVELYLTRLINNTWCVPVNYIFDNKDVTPVVHTFSIGTSQECDVCPSVLLQYSGNHGFTAYYVIHELKDVKYIHDNRHLFPRSSHYMWILKNNTVLELQGTNMFVFSSRSAGAIVLYVIIVSVIIWTLYEIGKLFFYKYQWRYQKL
ncbi:envelope glycoprotein H [Proboscivirus elephantidbeta4]|uniref:Envelope glycoprotein H n=1 Tax=Elephant endotheliotropic herpesvirus 4 TaxID=548914 RepID=A0A0S1TRW0_9BETA|nr:envelope glycoprotein H [Elephant endotheliotropic herpesvirus 4]ALM25998.1 envelope glycoprotein H [Elephant endotheliotropic herpesvirus 4]